MRTTLLFALMFLAISSAFADVTSGRISLAGTGTLDSVRVSESIPSSKLSITSQTGTVVDSFPSMLQRNKWYTFTIIGGHGIDTVTASAPCMCPDTLILDFGPLPITLSSFSVELLPEAGGIQVNWATVSEVNSYGFYVQRSSSPMSDFFDMTFIPGQGFSIGLRTYQWIDTAPLNIAYYRLRMVDLDGSQKITDAVEANVRTTSVEALSSDRFMLQQNYPNPFNPSTTVSFSITKPGRVMLRIYDMLGKEVAILANEQRQPGQYVEVFNALKLPSGIYVYRLQTPEGSISKRMNLLK
jgi:hypothetical protein